jgi:hypothetical protein
MSPRGLRGYPPVTRDGLSSWRGHYRSCFGLARTWLPEIIASFLRSFRAAWLHRSEQNSRGRPGPGAGSISAPHRGQVISSHREAPRWRLRPPGHPHQRVHPADASGRQAWGSANHLVRGWHEVPVVVRVPRHGDRRALVHGLERQGCLPTICVRHRACPSSALGFSPNPDPRTAA